MPLGAVPREKFHRPLAECQLKILPSLRSALWRSARDLRILRLPISFSADLGLVGHLDLQVHADVIGGFYRLFSGGTG